MPLRAVSSLSSTTRRVYVTGSLPSQPSSGWSSRRGACPWQRLMRNAGLLAPQRVTKRRAGSSDRTRLEASSSAQSRLSPVSIGPTTSSAPSTGSASKATPPSSARRSTSGEGARDSQRICPTNRGLNAPLTGTSNSDCTRSTVAGRARRRRYAVRQVQTEEMASSAQCMPVQCDVAQRTAPISVPGIARSIFGYR